MHTSALLVALVAAAVPAGDKKPEWQTSYSQAQNQGQSASKPLAVFLAPGKDGWQQLVREGKLSKEALEQLELLRASYGFRLMCSMTVPAG